MHHVHENELHDHIFINSGVFTYDQKEVTESSFVCKLSITQ
jgi:hypothetical protein